MAEASLQTGAAAGAALVRKAGAEASLTLEEVALVERAAGDSQTVATALAAVAVGREGVAVAVVAQGTALAGVAMSQRASRAGGVALASVVAVAEGTMDTLLAAARGLRHQ